MVINKRTKQLLQYGLVAILFFFLFRNIYANWEALRSYQWRFNYAFLGLSFALLFAALVAMLVIWNRVLSKLGHRLPLRTSWRIWFLSNLGHYLPGKVWQVMGMVYLCEKEKVPKVQTFTSIVLGLSLSSFTGLGLMYLYLLFGGAEHLARYSRVFLFFIPVGILVIYPPVYEKILNAVLRLFKKGQIRLHLRFSTIISLCLAYLVVWGLYGLAFFVFINAIYPLSHIHLPAVICMFSASYVLGFLAVFIPAGIGVREGLLTSFLSLLIPLHFATIVALLARLWFTAGELLGAGLGLRLCRR